MSRWARDPVVIALALLAVGVVLVAAAMVADAAYHPVAPPGERITFRWWTDIPMPAGGALVILGGAVAVASLARHRLGTRIGRWAMLLGLISALVNPLVALPAYLITRALRGEIPPDWGTPFELIWVISGVLAMVMGVIAREPRHRGILLIPAVLGIAVLTFIIGEVALPH